MKAPLHFLRSKVLRHATRLAEAMAAAMTVIVLAGCSNLLTPLGESTYDCNRKENPASLYCHSFKAVEASTSGAIPASRYDETMRLSDYDRMTGIAPVPRVAPTADGTQAALATPTTPSAPMARTTSLEGLPVREGPVVQRVWVKRFVDGNDLLVGETVIYKEIIGSHWLGFGRVDTGAAGSTNGGSAAPGKEAGSYPHRPPIPSPLKSVALSSASPANAVPTPSSSPGFTQPGVRAPAGEMAPVPAMSSGTTSMPQ